VFGCYFSLKKGLSSKERSERGVESISCKYKRGWFSKEQSVKLRGNLSNFTRR